MTYDPKHATLAEAAAYRAGLLRAAEICATPCPFDSHHNCDVSDPCPICGETGEPKDDDAEWKCLNHTVMIRAEAERTP